MTMTDIMPTQIYISLLSPTMGDEIHTQILFI